MVLMIPSLLWIRTLEPIRYHVPPAPQWWMAVNNMLVDCWSATLGSTVFPGYDWQVPRTAMGAFFERTYGKADAALLMLFGLGVLYITIRVVHGYFSEAPESRGKGGPGVRLEQTGFLLLWLVLPSVALFLLAHLWRSDVFSPKYTTHCSLAAYVLLGGAVSYVRRPALQAAVVCGLVALYGHRAGLMATHPQRPDWYSATDHIKAGYREGDGLVMFPFWQEEVLVYTMRPLTPEIRGTHDLREFCEAVEAALGTGGGVWALWVGGFGNVGFVHAFEAYLMQRGMAFSRGAFWGGMQCIFVVHVGESSGFAPAGPEEREAAYREAAPLYAMRPDATGEAVPVEDR